MVVEIDLFNDLDINEKNDFMDHIKYISGKLVKSETSMHLNLNFLISLNVPPELII